MQGRPSVSAAVPTPSSTAGTRAPRVRLLQAAYDVSALSRSSPQQVGVREVAVGLEQAGLGGRPVCLHVSLRSFGGIEGGPEAVVEGCRQVGVTLLSPSFSGSLFRVPPPPGDGPIRNGIDDYDALKRAAVRDRWPGLRRVYTSECTEVDDWLGTTPAYVARYPARVRGASPGGSWSPIGPLAATLVGSSIEEDDFGPLRRLVELNGAVVLMGITLTSLTLLHLAEVEAGRRPFIFWSRASDGSVIRNRGGRCGSGFEGLEPELHDLEQRLKVGQSEWRAYDAPPALAKAAAAIRADPEITRCGPDCIECRDAIAGGPPG